MGAWGPALFSDDTAADVRDGYRDLIGDGLSGPEATKTLVKQWGRALQDPDEASVFWLALAATQWQCGRLEASVKTTALSILEEGTDLGRWQENPKLLKKREAALNKLREQLLSPQPAEKRIPKRYRNTCDWEVGELIGYRLLSGTWFLFRVIGFHIDKGGKRPVCEMLDWSGTEIPSQDVLKHLRAKGRPFMLGRLKERDLPVERVIRLGMKTEPEQKPGGFSVLLWSRLDRQLRDWFGVA